MEFYFSPSDEEKFKKNAYGNYVRTLVFNRDDSCVTTCFVRKVTKLWSQTVKNNIESDQRIKDLPSGTYQIYSWVTKSENDFDLPLK